MRDRARLVVVAPGAVIASTTDRRVRSGYYVVPRDYHYASNRDWMPDFWSQPGSRLVLEIR